MRSLRGQVWSNKLLMSAADTCEAVDAYHDWEDRRFLFAELHSGFYGSEAA